VVPHSLASKPLGGPWVVSKQKENDLVATKSPSEKKKKHNLVATKSPSKKKKKTQLGGH